MNEFPGKWQGLCGFCPSEETFCQPSTAHDVDVCSRTVTMSRSGLFEHSGAPKSLCLSTFSLNENSMTVYTVYPSFRQTHTCNRQNVG